MIMDNHPTNSKKISHIPVQITRHWNVYATHQNSHEISENSVHWIVLKLIYMESDKKVGCNAVFQRDPHAGSPTY